MYSEVDFSNFKQMTLKKNRFFTGILPPPPPPKKNNLPLYVFLSCDTIKTK